MTEESEEWRPIDGTEGRYDVSNLGRVRSRAQVLKPGPNTDGYLLVGWVTNGKRVSRLVHNLVLEAFVGPRPGPFPPWEGAHDDGDKLNNRITNLKWCTKHQNADDKRRHGTMAAVMRPVEVRDGVKHYRCTQCDEWKPEDEFRANRNKYSACGRASACLACTRRIDNEQKKAKRLKAQRAAP